MSLKLADFAVIKATGEWQKGEALIQLGGKEPMNDIYTIGSNYSFEGGAIDGCGVANGISINGGRETAVRNVSIKHTVIGLHIKYGANSGSSDSDITGVNIIGTGATDSIGMLIEGFDNTVTNSRIARVQVGVHVKSAGNIFRNIHPLYTSDYTDYAESCAFLDECGNNIYDYCYSDQFAIGYRITNNNSSRFTNCFCMWYSSAGGVETAFKCDRKFCSVVSDFRVDFREDTENYVLKVGEYGGDGCFDNIIIGNEDSVQDGVYKAYENAESIFEKMVKLFWKIAGYFIVNY